MKPRYLLAAFVFPFIYWASTPPAAAATATFNFDADTTGTATPFSDTNTGITASFSGSTGDPGGFAVTPISGSFSTLTGNALLDPGPAGKQNIPLNISFSQPITSISFVFALDDPTNTTSMSFSNNAGASGSVTGNIPTGFRNPEGSLTFTGPAFTSVTLSSLALFFAVDDIVVTTATSVVALPATLPLFATGLVGLGLLGWRRKKKAAPLNA
jgi:hypothetical protein